MIPFWLNDWKVLIHTNNLTEFFPTKFMTMNQKLNSIVRFSFYASILLSILTSNFNYLYIFILSLFVTVIIYKYQKNNKEFFISTYNNNYTKPTKNNPFMNYNLITDSRFKEKATTSFDNPIVKEEIEENFNKDLFRNVGDLYGKNNSQRQYYTMPVTDVINDQTSFAKWLYGTPPTCKEKGIRCVPETSNIRNLTTKFPLQN